MPQRPDERTRQELHVGFVPGVSPDRWMRTWRERRRPARLDLVPVAAESAAARLRTGEGDAPVLDMVLLRLPVPEQHALELHSIPLWEELPVVVVPKDHPITLFDSVSETDLADENVLPGEDDATLDLVAAGVGVARMPQSVFRATGRRDVKARAVDDAAPTRIALVWLRERDDEVTQEFVGVVRGRTAGSSRG